MSNIEALVGKIVNLAESQQQLLRAYHGFSKQQTKAIRNEHMDELDKLINQRQSLIEQINEVDSKLSSQFACVREKYGIGSVEELVRREPSADRLLVMRGSINQLVQEIAELDKLNRELINMKFNGVKKQRETLQKGRLATSRYFKRSPEASGYFVDKKK